MNQTLTKPKISLKIQYHRKKTPLYLKITILALLITIFYFLTLISPTQILPHQQANQLPNSSKLSPTTSQYQQIGITEILTEEQYQNYQPMKLLNVQQNLNRISKGEDEKIIKLEIQERFYKCASIEQEIENGGYIQNIFKKHKICQVKDIQILKNKKFTSPKRKVERIFLTQIFYTIFENEFDGIQKILKQKNGEVWNAEGSKLTFFGSHDISPIYIKMMIGQQALKQMDYILLIGFTIDYVQFTVNKALSAHVLGRYDRNNLKRIQYIGENNRVSILLECSNMNCNKRYSSLRIMMMPELKIYRIQVFQNKQSRNFLTCQQM